ncbi:unnamed protein product [Closterium sp. NIES-54]
MAAESRGPHSSANIESSLGGETVIELLPSWAQRTLCPAGSGCGDGECELLHVDPTWRDVLSSRHVAHGEQSRDGSGAWGSMPRLIVCAGPERSGSTWLFNAVRLLLAHSGQLALSYWLHSISASKLRARGLTPLRSCRPGGEGRGEGGGGGSAELGGRGDGEGVRMDGGEWGGVSVVVKTHEWVEGWEHGVWPSTLPRPQFCVTCEPLHHSLRPPCTTHCAHLAWISSSPPPLLHPPLPRIPLSPASPSPPHPPVPRIPLSPASPSPPHPPVPRISFSPMSSKPLLATPTIPVPAHVHCHTHIDAGGSSSVITFTRFSLAIFRLSPPLPAASHLVCATPFIYSTTPAARPSASSTLVSAFPPSSSPSRMHSRTRIRATRPTASSGRRTRIKAHLQSYLHDHQRWKQHAAAVIPLASIMPPGSPSELLYLSRLAALLGLATVEGAAERAVAEGVPEGSGLEASLSSVGRGRGGGRAVDVCAVRTLLPSPLFPPPPLLLLIGHSPPSNLPPTPTAGWAPDPVTKLWPCHKGLAHADKGGSARGLTREERVELQQFVESLAPPDASAPNE